MTSNIIWFDREMTKGELIGTALMNNNYYLISSSKSTKGNE